MRQPSYFRFVVLPVFLAALLGVVAGSVAWTVYGPSTPESEAEGDRGSADVRPVLPRKASPETTTGTREPVELESLGGEPSLGDLLGSPASSSAASSAAEKQEDHSAELARLRLELEACRAQGTAYGAFLVEPWAGTFTPGERARVRYALEAVPVVLTPAEADWIARHEDELAPPGTVFEDRLVAFLGPARILRDLHGDARLLGRLRESLGDRRFGELFPGLLPP